MAIEGRLRELALSDVLQLLELSRKTGTLTVLNDARERPAVVRFEGGAIVGAELPDYEGRLGQLLLRSGKLTEAEMERVLRAQREKPALPFGALAVELGFVSAAEVKRHLVRQIEETVYELFRWKDGHFRFDETTVAPQGTVPVRIATQSLLMEAARRVDEWSALAARVPHPDVVPIIDDEPEADTTLDLEPKDWEVLSEIDGERTVKQIASELGRSDLEVAKTVFGLLSTRVVTLAEAVAPAAAPRPRDPLTQALAEAERLLGDGKLDEAQILVAQLAEAEPERAEVQVLQARVLGARHQWDDAVDCLTRAVRLDPLSAQAYYRLGFACVRTGDLGRAENAWSTYLRLADVRGPRAQTIRNALQAIAVLRATLEGGEG